MTAVWERRRQGASGNRLPSWASHSPTLLVALLAATSCTASPGLPPGPTIDARQVALQREVATQPERPLRAVFQWRINEGGARFSGQGVIRMEPPYKARLDLFLNNGEPILQAALVDDELRIPPGAPPGLVPPAPLLWVSLGVFRPGRANTLVSGATVGSSGVTLRYQIAEGGEATFGFTGGRVAGGELLRDGRVEETLSVEWGEEPDVVPESTLYRNLTAFRELEIEVDSFEFVESYPPDIWSIGS